MVASEWELQGASFADLLQEARYVIESVICDPNFEGLVLGCIEADFRNQILVGKLLTRSTNSTLFARPKFSKFAKNSRFSAKSQNFVQIFMKK